jgi:hypothetical protein
MGVTTAFRRVELPEKQGKLDQQFRSRSPIFEPLVLALLVEPPFELRPRLGELTMR